MLMLTGLVCSCSRNNTPSNNTPSVNTPSNSVNSDTPIQSTTPSSSTLTEEKLTKTKILSTLTEMKKGNFTLKYPLGNRIYEDVMTEKYFYTGYLNNGAVLLKTFSDTAISYDFQLINGLSKVELKGQTFNQEQTSQEIKTIDYANRLSKMDLTGVSFQQEQGTFTSKSQTLIQALANQLDFSGAIDKVVFYLEDSLLTFELKVHDLNGNTDYTPDGGKVSIKDVGSSSLKPMQDFLSQYQRPTETLEGKADNLFDNVSFESAIYDCGIDETKRLLGYSDLQIYNEYLKVTQANDKNNPYSVTYRKNKDGSMNKIGINAKNEVVDKVTTTTIDDFRLVGKDGFELDKFMKMNSKEDSYLYLGSDAKKLAYSVTQSTLFAKYPCLKIEAKVDNGKVTELHFQTGIMQDRDTGEFFYYRIDTSVRPSKEIKAPTKKTPSEEDSAIKTKLSYLNSEESEFTATDIDSAWSGKSKTVYRKGKGFYLKETYVRNGEAYEIQMANGYYNKDGHIHAFTYGKDYKVTLKGEANEKTMSEIVNFSISSEVLFLDNGLIKTYGDIIDIGKNLAFAYNPDFIDPATLSMETKEDKISTISFDYGGDLFSGSETITFDYTPTNMNSTLLANVNTLIDALPKRLTWQNYSSQTIYEAMVTTFGEETAKKVPYLTGIQGADGYENDTNEFIIYSMEDNQDYLKKYRDYILSLGYTTTDNTTYINEEDNLKLVVGNTMDEFLKIYALNPQAERS